MIKNDLTIIIPCYNCSETLEDAVASIYTQNLEISFDVMMVDDGSTDNTKEVIKKLARKHDNINYFFQDKNLGGGATRNTAIEKSSGKLIFCLDSDDILTPNMLSKMVEYLQNKKCDAVGISKSVKFKNKNVKDIAFTTNFGYINEKIPFKSLFEGDKCSLYSTFLHTRDSYHITGGYPTNHGFDTQGFAFRFLANGLTAYTCPEATYLHRVNFNRSYYIREYENGKASHNMFKIYEEFLYLFNNATKKIILNHDLNNSKNKLVYTLRQISDKFCLNIDNFLKNNSQMEFANHILKNNSLDKYDNYWLGSYYYSQKKYENAIKFLIAAINKKLDTPHLYYKLFDALAKTNNQDYNTVTNNIKKLYDYKPQGSKIPFITRILKKILK